MTKLNYRHSLNTLNKNLAESNINESVEFAYAQSGKDVYRLLEPGKMKNHVVECGIYYSKSDLVEYVNSQINKPKTSPEGKLKLYK